MNTLFTESTPGNADPPIISRLPDDRPLRRPTTAGSLARILYVEDEPSLRRIGEFILTRSGYDVDAAADDAEAWAALNDLNYNLLITDNALPRLTGFQLVTRVREAGMRLPIVIASGEPAGHGLSCQRLGLAVYLPKPFTPGELLNTVELALHTANHSRQAAGEEFNSLAALTRRAEPYRHGGLNE